MVDSDVRSQKRIPNKRMVDLIRTDGTQLRETTVSENLSPGGVRVATGKIWRPGSRVLLSSHETGVPTQAQVVYCQRLENGKFAVGLELLGSVGGRIEESQLVRAEYVPLASRQLFS